MDTFVEIGRSSDQKEICDLLKRALTMSGRKQFTHASVMDEGWRVRIYYFTERVEDSRPLKNKRSPLTISRILASSLDYCVVFYGLSEGHSVVVIKGWLDDKKGRDEERDSLAS